MNTLIKERSMALQQRGLEHQTKPKSSLFGKSNVSDPDLMERVKKEHKSIFNNHHLNLKNNGHSHQQSEGDQSRVGSILKSLESQTDSMGSASRNKIVIPTFNKKKSPSPTPRNRTNVQLDSYSNDIVADGSTSSISTALEFFKRRTESSTDIECSSSSNTPSTFSFALDDIDTSSYVPTLVRDSDKHRISVMQKARSNRSLPRRPRYCSRANDIEAAKSRFATITTGSAPDVLRAREKFKRTDDRSKTITSNPLRSIQGIEPGKRQNGLATKMATFEISSTSTKRKDDEEDGDEKDAYITIGPHSGSKKKPVPRPRRRSNDNLLKPAASEKMLDHHVGENSPCASKVGLQTSDSKSRLRFLPPGQSSDALAALQEVLIGRSAQQSLSTNNQNKEEYITIAPRTNRVGDPSLPNDAKRKSTEPPIVKPKSRSGSQGFINNLPSIPESSGSSNNYYNKNSNNNIRASTDNLPGRKSLDEAKHVSKAAMLKERKLSSRPSDEKIVIPLGKTTRGSCEDVTRTSVNGVGCIDKLDAAKVINNNSNNNTPMHDLDNTFWSFRKVAKSALTESEATAQLLQRDAFVIRTRRKSASSNALYQAFHEKEEKPKTLRRQHSADLLLRKKNNYSGAWGAGKSFGTPSCSILKMSQRSIDHLSREQESMRKLKENNLNTIPSTRPTIASPLNALCKGENQHSASSQILSRGRSNKQSHVQNKRQSNISEKAVHGIDNVAKRELELTKLTGSNERLPEELSSPLLRQNTMTKGVNASAGKKKVKLLKKRLVSSRRSLKTTTLSEVITTTTTTISTPFVKGGQLQGSIRRPPPAYPFKAPPKSMPQLVNGQTSNIAFVPPAKHDLSRPSVVHEKNSSFQYSQRRRNDGSRTNHGKGNNEHSPSHALMHTPSYAMHVEEEQDEDGDTVEDVEDLSQAEIHHKNSVAQFFKKYSMRRRSSRASRRSRMVPKRKESINIQLLDDNESSTRSSVSSPRVSSTMLGLMGKKMTVEELKEMPPWQREFYLRKKGRAGPSAIPRQSMTAL
eukprot:m.98725 g.98725  ORF g.98725 m.98725 type:complete len:1031 (+) comp9019_c0_seq6:264-3356(+)